MLDHTTSVQLASLLAQGARAEDLSEEFGVPLEVIKLLGARNGVVSDEDISEEEVALLRRHALNLAMNADSHSVQAQMTTFLLERARPARAAVANVNIITQINQALNASEARFKQLEEQYLNGKAS